MYYILKQRLKPHFIRAIFYFHFLSVVLETASVTTQPVAVTRQTADDLFLHKRFLLPDAYQLHHTHTRECLHSTHTKMFTLPFIVLDSTTLDEMTVLDRSKGLDKTPYFTSNICVLLAIFFVFFTSELLFMLTNLLA